ncbi:MAG: DNA-binding response regulator [Clostridiales bacterium 43-6]|nr:MAG: DNA-binding response regulator [Clostridiales bacterium 43-6]
MPLKIVLIEDNDSLRQELTIFLSRYGYDVKVPDDFCNIVEFVLEETAHLILLDINLPYYDGNYVCRELRKASSVPIIIITSRDSEADELMSINMGADDFVTKPFNTQILLARISALLKRAYNNDISMIEWKDLKLDTSKGVAVYGKGEIELTRNEIKILHLLMKNKDTIVTRETVMNELWQSDEFVDDNTLTVNINRLRKKLEQSGAIDYIKTKRGIGYMV